LQHVVKLACSEEVPEPVDMGGSGFSVAFDPLDGSSIVDTNFAVGTIVGIWPGDKLDGITGREQVGGWSGVGAWVGVCVLSAYVCESLGTSKAQAGPGCLLAGWIGMCRVRPATIV
jgi:sedoheptulose-bisphosphatase